MSERDDEEAECEQVEDEYRDGEITLDERNKRIREITRWWRDAALDAAAEAAREAHDRELERW